MTKAKILRVVVLVVGVILGIAMTCESVFAQQDTKKALRVNGAIVGVGLVNLWAKEFMAFNPGIDVLVVGSSAGKGFEDLIDGNADLALASRSISVEEQAKAAAKGMQLSSRQIGHAGVAVITSRNNPINELTMEQVRKIFAAEYTNWKEAGGPDVQIRCFTRRVPMSGGAVFFREKVLHNQPYGRTTTFVEDWATIPEVCATAKDLPIGIVPAFMAKNNFKILALKQDEAHQGLLPSEESLQDLSYPIANPIQFYWDKRSEDDRILRFVAFCAGKGLPKK